jgi:hypothetical protein
MKLTSSDKGALVAVANLLTVTLCVVIFVETGHPVEWRLASLLPFEGYLLGFVIVDLAVIPALLVGVVVGLLAGRLPGSPVARYAVLAAASFAAVALFGWIAGWIQLIPLASLPTLAWTLRLERWTRAGERVPVARAA